MLQADAKCMEALQPMLVVRAALSRIAAAAQQLPEVVAAANPAQQRAPWRVVISFGASELKAQVRTRHHLFYFVFPNDSGR